MKKFGMKETQMNLLMAVLALCVLVALNIFQVKRKNPHDKITISFVIVLIFGILIFLGLRYLMRRGIGLHSH
jgi:FtsH-binding integral membrane protein